MNGRLVVVSNRVGPLSDEGQAGGLAVGLADALKSRGGIWFGWSGTIGDLGSFGEIARETVGKVDLCTVDMSAEDDELFYRGYANRSLWPLLHYRLDLADFSPEMEASYRYVNQRMAARLMPLVEPDDTIWVHDYHYLLMGRELRALDAANRIGFFLHIPFPPPEIFAALPNANDIVRSMMAYNLIGFQTQRDRRNFAHYVEEELGGTWDGDTGLTLDGREVHVGAFPIGIDAEGFASLAASAPAVLLQEKLATTLGRQHQVLGVDRLDYSKGIPERFRAFERLLIDHPENRGKVSLLQIAPLSRSELDTYRDLRSELEGLAGNINGSFSSLDWTPIRMITRSFRRQSLAGISRASRVGLITPLRDGMNLVAKEYVAAQDPSDPGVLVLSRFAGAAHELKVGALIVNPHDPEDVAAALQKALTMELGERQRRWQAMRDPVFTNTAQSWCRSFLEVLATTLSPKPSVKQPSYVQGQA